MRQVIIYRVIIAALCLYAHIKADPQDTLGNQQYNVDFDVSMEFPWHDRFDKKNNPFVLFCKKLYNKNNLSQLAPQEAPLIPKIVHLIWVGPKPQPPIMQKCLDSISKFLPAWQCKIWTDADIPSLNLTYQQYYDEETNYGAKSDILRLELLYRYGGLYLDVDFEILQSLDILHHTYEFYACLQPGDVEELIGNSVIGTIPNHPVIKHCLENLANNRWNPDILRRTGPVHFEESFAAMVPQLPDARIIAFPKSYFFPINYFEENRTQEHIESLIKPEAFGIHYWAGSWLDENYLRLISNKW